MQAAAAMSPHTSSPASGGGGAGGGSATGGGSAAKAGGKDGINGTNCDTEYQLQMERASKMGLQVQLGSADNKSYIQLSVTASFV